MKLTYMGKRDEAMENNQHGSATYGDWCKKEVKRIGGDARYVEEYRITVNGKKEIVPEGTSKAVAWCRVDRV